MGERRQPSPDDSGKEGGERATLPSLVGERGVGRGSAAFLTGGFFCQLSRKTKTNESTGQDVNIFRAQQVNTKTKTRDFEATYDLYLST